MIDGCREYDGLSGKMLKLWDQVGGEGPNVWPPGSAEWAAQAELGKLNVIIDSLRLRAAKAVDPELGADLQREAAFLESRATHFEQVLAGLVAESDPRFIARMTQQTSEAYRQKFPHFEDYPGIDASKYWYVDNPKAPPPYSVYHEQGVSPRLELVADATHESGFSLSKAAEKVAHVFGPGTTRQAALEQITQSGKSFGPYREMLLKSDLATDDDILKAMMEPAGVTEDTLRHALKKHYRPRVMGRMFVDEEGPLSAAESIDAFHGMTKNLNSADAGNIGEEWYQRYSRTFNDEALESHPRFTDPSGKTRLPDFVQRGGRIEGNAAVEVKSTTRGLSSSRDVPQITETLKLAQSRGSVVVNGRSMKISRARLVFTNASGAQGSLKPLENFFKDFKEVLTVEVFFNSGPQSFTDFAALKAALGD